MKKLKVHVRDFVALFIMCAFFFVILWLKYNYFPWLIDLSAIPWLV